MSFDKAVIFVKAGKGGCGSSNFMRGKYMPVGKPDGGNGGKGGDVIVVANSNINTLLFFKHKKKFIAGDGGSGSARLKTGKDGESVRIEVPLGTEIYDEGETIKISDLRKHGDFFILARGGRGGIGNQAFKSGANRSPRQTIPPRDGDEGRFVLSMSIISDAGIIGMPNVGKSSFLNAATNAKSKIADYSFTTIDPQLGFAEVENFDGVLLADIPGLISGSSQGRGLGHKFLKHIERCPALIHIVSAEGEDQLGDYNQTRLELKSHNPDLLKKAEFVVMNKIDAVASAELKKKAAKFSKAIGKKVYLSSAKEGSGILEVLRDVFKFRIHGKSGDLGG